MLSLRDNLVLAITKLRTRPIRLAVTLIVSGLLFSVLIIMSLVVRGLVGSLESFTKDGYLSRYIVTVSNMDSFDGANKALHDPKIIDRAIAIQNARIAAKSTEAKRLGIEYDPKTEPKPYLEDEQGPGGKAVKTLDMNRPVARQALSEMTDDQTFVKALKQRLAPYHPVGVSTSTGFSQYYSSSNFSLTPIIGGKEQQQAENYSGPGDPISSFGQTLSSYEDTMLQPLLLEGSSLSVKPGDPIPVLAPFSAAEKLLGLTEPPAKASPTQRLEHLGTVRARATNFEFSVCFRNVAALELQTTAKAQATEIASRKGEAGYLPPTVIYGQPTTACTPIPIAKDTRAASEKLSDATQLAFNQQFGQVAPVTKPIKFKIVGLVAQTDFSDSAFSVSALIGSFLTPNLGSGWIASRRGVNANPELAAVQNDKVNSILALPTHYVELPDRATQKRLIDELSCQPSPNNECSKQGDLIITPYGNPLATLRDLSSGFDTFVTYLLGIIAAISALIMMGTIGKVIADSRKETSVFRALGARRLQIVQIYALYASILGMLAFILALVIGLATASLLDASSSAELSVKAVLAFNSHDLHKVFHIVGWSPLDLAKIALLALGTSLLGAALPLLTSLRRNPVKDMRDE